MKLRAGRKLTVTTMLVGVAITSPAVAATPPDLLTAALGGAAVNETEAQQSLSLSANGGRIAFSSTASDLVQGDSNGVRDVFVRDLANGTTVRVSVSSGGGQANGASSNPQISAGGRFVVFSSQAANLVQGDSNGVLDVFVHDLELGTTRRVSVAAGGAQGTRASGDAPSSISADGRFVSFASSAPNLVAGDANNARDLFVADRAVGALERVAVQAGGSSISADGSRVAVVSSAALAGSDRNGVDDVYLVDRAGAVVDLASSGSLSAASLVADGLSADGSSVVFKTSSALVPNDRNGLADIYLRRGGVTELLSSSLGGGAGSSGSSGGSVSADGRFVAFESTAVDLDPADRSNDRDIFVRDRIAGITRAVTTSSVIGQVSQTAAISGDGGSVAFTSTAHDIVPGDVSKGIGKGWDSFRTDSPLEAPDDSAAPIVQCQQPDGVWHAQNVVLRCTAHDEGSGIPSEADTSFELRTTIDAGEESGDAATGSRQVCDLAGNCATAGPIRGNRVDRRAPTIGIAAPTEDMEVALGRSFEAVYACEDAGSGPAACDGPVPNGGEVVADVPGPRVFAVTAVDRIGNTATYVVTWYARYAFAGFEPPLRDGMDAQAGRALPLKFSIEGGDASGALRSIGSVAVSCATGAALADSEPVALIGNGMTWKTEKGWAGSCRALAIGLDDGSTHSVILRFR